MVAPSDGGGTIESDVTVEGEDPPLGFAVAGPPALTAEMLGEESEPDTISGAPAVLAGVEIVGAVVVVALTSKVGAADTVDASVADVVVVTTVVGTATIWFVSVVVVVETIVLSVDSVIDWAGEGTAAEDRMFDCAGAEVIGALFDVPIRVGATVGVFAPAAGALPGAVLGAGAWAEALGGATWAEALGGATGCCESEGAC